LRFSKPPTDITIIGADPESHRNYLQHDLDSRVDRMSFGDAIRKLGRLSRFRAA
jgi:hypothetical protein